MNISIQELTKLPKQAIKKFGYSEDETQIILDMLMYAQMRGNDQGIVKLIGNGIPKNEKALAPTIEKETPTTAIINANLSMEAIAMEQAVNMAIKKAKEMGIAIVGTHTGDGSSGAVGYWSRKIADAGLIGITMSSYPYGMVPPYGSYEPLFCTNPIAWAVPTDNEPIVLDMSSSGISYYGLLEKKTQGVQVAEGLGYDKNGNETTNPAEILEGAIRPFDKGSKGAGLATFNTNSKQMDYQYIIIVAVNFVFGLLIALFIGLKRKIGFTNSLLASILLTALIGLIVTLLSNRREE